MFAAKALVWQTNKKTLFVVLLVYSINLTKMAACVESVVKNKIVFYIFYELSYVFYVFHFKTCSQNGILIVSSHW